MVLEIHDDKVSELEDALTIAANEVGALRRRAVQGTGSEELVNRYARAEKHLQSLVQPLRIRIAGSASRFDPPNDLPIPH